MFKNLLLILSVVIAIVVGIALYFWFTRPIIPPYQSDTQKESESQKFKQSIESGSPISCTYSANEVTTTYIISGNRSFVENVSRSKNQSQAIITSYMLNTGNQIYLWNSSSKLGSVIEQKPVDPDVSTSDNFNAHLTFPKNESYKIRCVDTQPDESVFFPPNNINFKPTTPRY